MSKLKIGDVVELKSGGPRMTVAQIGGPYNEELPQVWCVWFVENQRLQDTFYEDMLRVTKLQVDAPIQTHINL